MSLKLSNADMQVLRLALHDEKEAGNISQGFIDRVEAALAMGCAPTPKLREAFKRHDQEVTSMPDDTLAEVLRTPIEVEEGLRIQHVTTCIACGSWASSDNGPAVISGRCCMNSSGDHTLVATTQTVPKAFSA